jgi:hypothetical protein
LRGGEHTPNYQGRARQFLDGPYALGDKELVSFAGFPSAKVARKGQETHVFTVGSEDGNATGRRAGSTGNRNMSCRNAM